MIIATNNNKGGSLKTTTTTNLAGVMAAQKKKVLIVDSDAQSNVSLTFGLNPDDFRTTLYDVLTTSLPAEDAIIKVHKYIDILPSNDDLISFDFEVIGNPDRYPEPFSLMKNALGHLRSQYDYILIDTPPALSLMVGNAFSLADRILIPFTPEFYSMRSLISVIKTIRDFIAEYNENLDILGVIRVMVNTNTTLHSDIIQKTNIFAKEQGIHVFEAMLPRTIEFANAVANKNLPATMARKKYKKSEIYFDLWKEIEGQLRKEVVR